MTRQQYEAFGSIRDEFRAYVESLNSRTPWLASLQEELRESAGHKDYRVETPIVYNRSLDEVTLSDEPRFIIVADNPGKNEQKPENLRYLVGQSGKLAQGWFSRVLDSDFRASSLIINKTPIHTPRTAELGMLRNRAYARSRKLGEELDRVLDESQRTMAGFAFRLHSSLSCVLWISGYGELKPGRLFSAWTDEMRSLYSAAPPPLRDNLWVFRHFSMNQFSIEYDRDDTEGSALEKLKSIGSSRRRLIFGF